MSYLQKIEHVDLEQFNHGVEEYHQGWRAADQYAYNIMMGIVPAGRQIKNAVGRYIFDRTQRTDLDFRTDDIDDVIRFSNLLKHVKGPLSGKPVRLLNWMIFVVANIYGWYYNSGTKIGKRRFTKAFTLVARGNAKSFLCSIIALWTQLTSPNGSPAGYCVARQREQARIVFDDACKMLRSADPILRRWFNPAAHHMDCVFQDGSFKPMSSDSQSIDGHRVALGIADELHAHHNSEQLNTLITGTSATVDPLIFMISTAGIQLDGVCITERNLVRDINEGMEHLDEYFGVEYAIDDDDDWHDETKWVKANPSMGHAVNMDSLRSEVVRAKQSAVNRKNFLTKYCNIFVNTNENPYLDVLELQTNCGRTDLNIRDYMGRELFLGLDLAQKFDLAALSFLFPEEDGTLTIFQRHYFPDGALKKLTAYKYESYLQWEEDGHLIMTPGMSTDFDFIEEDIRWAAKNFDLQMVGYDPYAGTQMSLKLQDEGIDMVEVRQGIAQMSEPAKQLLALIAESKLNYQLEDKCFEWCAANSAVKTDLNENIKVHKSDDKPHDKIDSIIALITGLSLVTLKEPKPKNPYKKRGLVVL